MLYRSDGLLVAAVLAHWQQSQLTVWSKQAPFFACTTCMLKTGIKQQYWQFLAATRPIWWQDLSEEITAFGARELYEQFEWHLTLAFSQLFQWKELWLREGSWGDRIPWQRLLLLLHHNVGFASVITDTALADAEIVEIMRQLKTSFARLLKTGYGHLSRFLDLPRSYFADKAACREL